VNFTSLDACKAAVVALIGLFLIAILDKLKVKGSVILGILAATLIGIPVGVTDLSILQGNVPGISWKFWENFANFFTGENTVFASFINVFTGEGITPAGVSVFSFIMILITLCMIDMFDTMGTIVGCCGGNRILSDENNKPHNYGKIMISDAVATCTGAMLGTSTVTTFVESSAGVAAGGRTGLTALTTGILFLLSTLFSPLFTSIPSFATAPALIFVGFLMFETVAELKFDTDKLAEVIPAYLCIIAMPLFYSISEGICLGVISFVVLKSLTGKAKEVKPLMWILAILFVLKYIFL
jgi:AGZA family xanthine/uracil permease-like MFS transporter